MGCGGRLPRIAIRTGHAKRSPPFGCDLGEGLCTRWGLALADRPGFGQVDRRTARGRHQPAAVTVCDPLFGPRTAGHHRPGRDCPHRTGGPGHPPRPRAARMTACTQPRFRSATADPRRRPPLRNRGWRAAPATGYRNHARRLLRPQPQHQPPTRTPSAHGRHAVQPQPNAPGADPHRHTHRSQTRTAADSQHQRADKSKGVSAAHRDPGKGPGRLYLAHRVHPRAQEDCPVPPKTGFPELPAMAARHEQPATPIASNSSQQASPSRLSAMPTLAPGCSPWRLNSART